MKKFIYILLFFTFTTGFAGNKLPANAPLSVSSVIQDSEKVVLTPNPATTFTQIKLLSEDQKITEVAVYSMLGNKLLIQAYSGSERNIQLNVQNFKRGKYLVKIVFSDGTSEVKALIKQ